MRKFISLVFVALIGSASTVGYYYVREHRGAGHHQVPLYFNQVPVGTALYTIDSNNNLAPFQFTTAAEKVMPGVVHITSTLKISSDQRGMEDPFGDFFQKFFGPGYRYEQPSRPQGPQTRIGSGSGVIINDNGYIVTNDHVIENADQIEVTLHDNRTYEASVVGIDPSTDLALIKIDATGLDYISFGNSDNVRVGEWVLAVGNPFNLTSTVTAGIVSAKGRNINILQDQYAVESFIQTDAAINPGNSGGALVDISGGLIGVNTAIASPTGAYAGYGFAVPSNIVSKVVKDLLEFGTVHRGYLGVTIREINSKLAEEKDLDVMRGVYVDSVLSDGAAAKAGIKENDVILKADDRNITTVSQLLEMIARKHPGEKMGITIDRAGKTKEFTVTLKKRSGENMLSSKNENEPLALLGADLENIDKETAGKLDIEGGVRVKKLYPGKLKSQTEMKEGFIITMIDHKAVNKVEDVIKILKDKKGGGVLIEGMYENYPGEYYYALGL